MKVNKLSYNIISLLFIILFTSPVFGQQKQHIELDKTLTNKSVYVLSNRETTLQNNSEITLNSVKKTTGLDFIKAKVYSKDSLQIEKIDSTDFISEISLLEGNCLVFVHGDAKTLEESIYRGLKIQKLYNINVLIYSWPSRDPDLNGSKNYKRSQLHVNESIYHFMEVLNFTETLTETDSTFHKTKKISLFIHSLGNLYLEKMVEYKLEIGLPKNLFDNIIINSAAVDEKNHKAWVEKLNMQKHLFIISNKNDFNLKGAHLFTTSGKQLGEKITSPFASNATYMNFNKTIGFTFPTANTHTYFIGGMATENKNLKEFYNCILNGENPDFENKDIYHKRKDNISFEIIITK